MLLLPVLPLGALGEILWIAPRSVDLELAATAKFNKPDELVL
jgi:hypothetical protein